MQDEERQIRSSIASAERIVVKVGTRVLSSSTGALEKENLRNLVRQIAALHKEGKEILLVSSGAVAAGVEALGFKSRPKRMPELQMTAAVGQAVIMAKYREEFAPYGIQTGQVLLIQDSIEERKRHLNVRNTLFALLNRRIVPIINENDTVSTAEMKFGDNDTLASLITLMVGAEALIILTTTDGVCRWEGEKLGSVISHIPQIDDAVKAQARGPVDGLSLGGMKTKVDAASRVVQSGGVVGIVNGYEPDALLRFVAGEQLGTICGRVSSEKGSVNHAKKRWLAFFGASQGKIFVDDGAAKALSSDGRSLLPVGVRALEGSFSAGAFVDLCKLDGGLIARGLVDFSSAELEKIKGLPSSQIEAALGYHLYDEVVHRDNLVLVER